MAIDPSWTALTEEVRRRPTIRGLLRLIVLGVRLPLRTAAGVVLASTTALLLLWGPGGVVPLLGEVWSGWQPASSRPAQRPSVIAGVPWDQEWIAFAIGFVLLVLVPIALIKWVLREDLRDYGLGLPERPRVKISVLAAGFLLLVGLPAFVVSTGDTGMQATYPLYHGDLDGWDFVIYELGYLAFFITVEFVFRGYLLFGLLGAGRNERLGLQAIVISTLVYVVWHIDRPTPELLGALVFGPPACAIALATRSIWPLVLVHWLLNVVLDLLLR
ncbi:MAG TPA: CPBP family intramembrane glutamic endopeptidase [Solirubrobacteraceae bacterium]|jgi:membrane protease YdiL (CAAX protease family)|nr:CPBP family intramembrane glutamic endopeptidase [Solirubrobacteraceae bacterium]